MKILMVGLDKNSLGEDFITVGEKIPGKNLKLLNLFTGEKAREVWKILTEVQPKEVNRDNKN